MNRRLGIYPGSFDPVHLGHVDLVRRAARIAERLVVGVLENPGKRCLFTTQERVAMLEECLDDLPNVEVAAFRGLLVEFARRRGATVVFRGLRAISDFDYEYQMALMNRRLDASVETVFLMPSIDHTYVSSRLVKEVARLGGDVSDLVPASALRALAARCEAEPS